MNLKRTSANSDRVERALHVGRELKNARLAKDLTQEAVILCSGAYSNVRTLRKIEAGILFPPRLKLIRLWRFGLDIQEIPSLNEILAVAGYSPLERAELHRLGLVVL